MGYPADVVEDAHPGAIDWPEPRIRKTTCKAGNVQEPARLTKDFESRARAADMARQFGPRSAIARVISGNDRPLLAQLFLPRTVSGNLVAQIRQILDKHRWAR